MSHGRRALALVALAIAFAIAPVAIAQDTAVPIAVQATLLAKLAAYDRNLPARAGGRVVVVILAKPHDVGADRAAVAMEKALAEIPTIAGLPHVEERVDSTDLVEIGAFWRAKHPTIVYVTPGFDEGEIQAITSTMTGLDVLSAGGNPSYVPRGIVLGFDLVSGRPKILVHLGQARRQNVALGAEVLKLMRVYE